MKRINPKIDLFAINETFKFFDSSKRGSISYEEFRNGLSVDTSEECDWLLEDGVKEAALKVFFFINIIVVLALLLLFLLYIVSFIVTEAHKTLAAPN